MKASSDAGHENLIRQVSNMAAMDPDYFDDEIANDDADEFVTPEVLTETERALDKESVTGTLSFNYS